MKFFLIGFALLALMACGNNSDFLTDNPVVTTNANKNTLTSTRWCAENDSDDDGLIGTFLFDKNGSVEWVGYNIRTQRPYSRTTMNWVLENNFLQIDREIETNDGVTITFSNFGADMRMAWSKSSKNPQTPQTPGEPSQGILQPATFVGKPCNLDL